MALLPIKNLQCIVDDTALITNIGEIQDWVLRGSVKLVIPLHTLERLHLLKKDSSQIGQNARKAVKFLDDVTSNPETEDRITIQGPDDGYSTWAEVEAHYTENRDNDDDGKGSEILTIVPEKDAGKEGGRHDNHSIPGTTVISQAFEKQMHIAKDPRTVSPLSTPPLSPSSSGLQSSKTSPEVKSASLLANDVSPVPQTLKPLINPVVWYTHERRVDGAGDDLVFLTNSSDTSYIARDFGVRSKNIHQLRAVIGPDDQEVQSLEKHSTKYDNASRSSTEPPTLFRYDEGESDEEEVVFKPRGKGTPRNSNTNPRGAKAGSVRSKKSHGHSPANSMSVSAPALPNKPQIPTEEIDPDSFDRGGFARGSTPLVSVSTGSHASPVLNGYTRGQAGRSGTAAGSGSSRGQGRGGARGGHDRGGGGGGGGGRGRGRLFVP